MFISLGLTASALATDVAIRKKMFGSCMTTLIISNQEMNDMKIVKSHEESGLLIMKGVSETIQNEARVQKGRFCEMLLGTLGASLLGNTLAGKGVMRTGNENNQSSMISNDLESSTIRVMRQQSRPGFLMPPHHLTNFEIQKYYQSEPKFNDIYSRNNLPKIDDKGM